MFSSITYEVGEAVLGTLFTDFAFLKISLSLTLSVYFSATNRRTLLSLVRRERPWVTLGVPGRRKSRGVFTEKTLQPLFLMSCIVCRAGPTLYE